MPNNRRTPDPNSDMLDPDTIQALLEQQGSFDLKRMPTDLRQLPPTAAGLANLKVYQDKALNGTTTGGYVVEPPDGADADRMDNALFLRPTNQQPTTAGHEIEHLLARRGIGAASDQNKVYDELLGDPNRRMEFVNNVVSVGPYLKDKYGVESAYLDPKMVKFQGPLAKNLIYEQLATLASIESTKGVDLTKDPVLRKSLFKDKDVRETYNAITGLRQTRLDAKDLPPYTRQAEKPDPTQSTAQSTAPTVGAIDKLKKLIGMAEGGSVPHAGNKKII